MGWFFAIMFFVLWQRTWSASNRAVASTRLLSEYNDWLESLDLEEMSRFEVKILDQETDIILGMHARGEDYDDIIRRRLERVRLAKGRQDTRPA